MKKGDYIWLITLLAVILILIIPYTRYVFIEVTQAHPFLMGFVKLAVLATMGELLALRIINKKWLKPQGIQYRAFIWGLLGMSFVIVFEVFAGGTRYILQTGLVPLSSTNNLTFALLTSTIMNVTFGPTMMAFHRITDTYIDNMYSLAGTTKRLASFREINDIDWGNFVSFVILKTIPIFWIPAHTITFLLPPEFRVLMAAFLSIALGGILAFAKRK